MIQINLTENNNPLISIVILNWNAGEILLDCVQSVMESNYDNFEVLVD